jgi:alpha,alpha-trehalase
VPRFDSPSIFGAVLDRGAGRFRLGPRETVPVARRYVPGTNVLETTWATATGWLLVHDALSVGRGATAPTTRTRARPRTSMPTGCSSGSLNASSAPDLLFTSDLNLAVEHQRLEARHRIVDGERRFCALAWGAEPEPPASAERPSSASTRPPSTGAAGSRPAPSPTIHGGSTCSARR